MLHHFDPDIAERYGVNEAIILYNIAFWVDKNEKNEHNFFEGHYWTYNSTKAYKKQFPYMSERTIQRVIKNLIDEGIIVSGKFSSDSRDRTHYYTLTDYGASITTNSHVALRQNGVSNTGDGDKLASSLFNKNTDSADINNTDVNNISHVISREVAELDSMFEQFWKAYPKKVDPKGCKKKFVKIKNLKQIFPDIMSALETQKQSKQWNEENGRFIPNPSTWINQERWNISNAVEEKQMAIEEIASEHISDFYV